MAAGQRFSRRAFLVAGATVVVAACSDDGDSTQPPPDTATPLTEVTEVVAEPDGSVPATTTTAPALAADPFTLGVASGDPDEQSVVLWTRLAPDPTAGGGMPVTSVTVTWEISADETFAEVAQSGQVTAEPADGHAVHVVVDLPQGGWWYRFRAGGHTSAVGRTRCAPPIGSAVESSTFAAASCQNWEQGYYAALADVAAQRPDFVVWLGDYIYEGAGAEIGTGGALRAHGGTEARTLDDYRNRYALYRSDAALRAAHAAAPWFVIWDDHEVENNYAGLTPQDAAEAATFPARRAAAYRAWWEHMPVRLEPPPVTGPYRTYRNVLWGDLLGLTLLDGRQFRSDQACGDRTFVLEPPCPEVLTAGRTMLGGDQQDFVFDIVGRESTVWNVIGNQTVLTDLTVGAGVVLNFDQWDGYPEARNALLDHLAAAAVPNLVVLTGDIHAAIVGQLRAGDKATGAPVGVEFVSTSISSSGLLPAGVSLPRDQFPAVVDVEVDHRGYTMHRINRTTWIAEYRLVEDAADPASAVRSWKAFAVDADGSNTVREARFA